MWGRGASWGTAALGSVSLALGSSHACSLSPQMPTAFRTPHWQHPGRAHLKGDLCQTHSSLSLPRWEGAATVHPVNWKTCFRLRSGAAVPSPHDSERPVALGTCPILIHLRSCCPFPDFLVRVQQSILGSSNLPKKTAD